MKKSIVALTLLVVAIPFLASTQTAADLQAQIQALLAQVAALQQQLSSTTPTQPTAVPGGSCPSLGRNLSLGMSGGDVSALQTFLARDASVYPEAQTTGYFGQLTERAVQRWQVKYNIVTSGTPQTTGFGSVGPSTRASIERVCGYPSSYNPGTTPTTPTLPPPTTVGNCVLPTGPVIQAGTSARLYSRSSAPDGARCDAFAQTRVCVNGALTGDGTFVYPTCSERAGQSCVFNGLTFPQGAVRTFYLYPSVSSGTSCSATSQVRTCNNGVFTGDSAFNNLSCVTTQPNNCVVNGTEVLHGASRSFYNKTLVAFGSLCSATTTSQVRTCTNGNISGDATFDKATCAAATSSACVLNGVTANTGATGAFFASSTVPFGTLCSAVRTTRLCTNGVFDETKASYQYASCAVAEAQSCSLDGLSANHNVSKTFYSSRTVAFGTSCTSVSLSRKCNNGSYEGDSNFKYATCEVEGARSCSLDGQTFGHDETRTFYDRRTVNFGEACTSYDLVRKCSNGTIQGDAAYQFASCAVGNAPAPACTLQTEKAVYLPNEQVKFLWTTVNTISASLLNVAIPTASLSSGSRANAISYSAAGDRTVTMSVAGNQNTAGQCSAVVKVQNVLPPTCTINVKKAGATGTGTSAVSVNYEDDVQITWTSSGALNYATSSSSVGFSPTTTSAVASGSRTFRPKDRTYTYKFYNDGGSVECAVSVNYNAPTCDPVTTNKTSYIFGDPVTFTWNSKNADYATATSSDRTLPSGSYTLPNVTATRTFNFTFFGLGGQQMCSKTITIPTPLLVTSASQSGSTVNVSWQYTSPPANVKVMLVLIDLQGNYVSGTPIATNLPASSSYGWAVSSTLGTTNITSGQYKIRAIGYTESCTGSSCVRTEVARGDSATLSVSVSSSMVSQLASVIEAIEALLRLLR